MGLVSMISESRLLAKWLKQSEKGSKSKIAWNFGKIG